MSKYIHKLTQKQIDLMPIYRDKWIEIGLRTGKTDWDTFEKYIPLCYEKANITFPNKIIRVSSPLVGALASAITEAIFRKYGAVGGAVRRTISEAINEAVYRTVGGAVDEAVCRAVCGEVDRVVGGAVSREVYDTVRGTVDGEVRKAVDEAVGGAVDEAVCRAVCEAVNEAIDEAVDEAVCEAVDEAVNGAVNGAINEAVDGTVCGAIGRTVDEAVCEAVNEAVNEAVDEAVCEAVCEAVDEAVNGAVNGAINEAVDGTVDGEVRKAVDKTVGEAVGGALDEAVREAVDEAVGGAVGEAVGGALDRIVGGAVYRAVDKAVEIIKKLNLNIEWHFWLGGQFWVGGWYYGNAYADFFINGCNLQLSKDIVERFNIYKKINESVNYWWPNKNFVMVCARPIQIYRNSKGQLHCENDMAIKYPDGWGLWMLNGVQVSKELVMTSADKLDCNLVLKEKNAEVRREIIRKIGIDRVIDKLGAKSIGRLEGRAKFFSRLFGKKFDYEYELLNFDCIDGRFRPYLKMLNPSIGTWHIEGVHPNCDTIEKALAWRDGEEIYEQPEILT